MKTFDRYLTEKTDYTPVAYHGTSKKFRSFDDRNPVFFVDRREVAETFGPYITKVRLDFDNPVELDFSGGGRVRFFGQNLRPSEVAHEIKEMADEQKIYGQLDDDVIQELESLGWDQHMGDIDGVIMHNISDSWDGPFSSLKPATNYVVFDKRQIKVL